MPFGALGSATPAARGCSWQDIFHGFFPPTLNDSSTGAPPLPRDPPSSGGGHFPLSHAETFLSQMSALSSHPRPPGLFPLSLTFPCFHSMPGTSAWVLLILTESHGREQKGGWGLEKWKSGLGDTVGKPSPAERSGGTCAHPLVHWEGAGSHPGTEPCPHSGHSRSRAWRDKENNPQELISLIWEQLPGQGQRLHTNSISGVKIPSALIAGSALFIIPPKGILL